MSRPLISYPFPVKGDAVASLYLPVDLTVAEAERLKRYIETLVIVQTKEGKL